MMFKQAAIYDTVPQYDVHYLLTRSLKIYCSDCASDTLCDPVGACSARTGAGCNAASIDKEALKSAPLCLRPCYLETTAVSCGGGGATS